MLSFERACVAFTIAALQSQVASTQSTDTDDGLKTSAKLLQVSLSLEIEVLNNLSQLFARHINKAFHHLWCENAWIFPSFFFKFDMFLYFYFINSLLESLR